jgi:hypothetical protein
MQVITEALPKSVGPALIGLVTSRDKIPDLLKVNKEYLEVEDFWPPCSFVGGHSLFVLLQLHHNIGYELMSNIFVV